MQAAEGDQEGAPGRVQALEGAVLAAVVGDLTPQGRVQALARASGFFRMAEDAHSGPVQEVHPGPGREHGPVRKSRLASSRKEAPMTPRNSPSGPRTGREKGRME